MFTLVVKRFPAQRNNFAKCTYISTPTVLFRVDAIKLEDAVVL